MYAEASCGYFGKQCEVMFVCSTTILIHILNTFTSTRVWVCLGYVFYVGKQCEVMFVCSTTILTQILNTFASTRVWVRLG